MVLNQEVEEVEEVAGVGLRPAQVMTLMKVTALPVSRVHQYGHMAGSQSSKLASVGGTSMNPGFDALRFGGSHVKMGLGTKDQRKPTSGTLFSVVLTHQSTGKKIPLYPIPTA